MLKYTFHAAVGVLFPMVQWRYFLRFQDYNTGLLLLSLVSGSFFIFMAQWSYMGAQKGNDPGYVDWEHFRNQE